MRVVGCVRAGGAKAGLPTGDVRVYAPKCATVNHQHTGISLSHPSNIRGCHPASPFHHALDIDQSIDGGIPLMNQSNRVSFSRLLHLDAQTLQQP